MNKIHVETNVTGSMEKVWKFTTRMSAKDKGFSFDFSGTYTDVAEHAKIGYVMSDDINDSAEMQQSGWQSILNNFKKDVEAA